MSSFRYVCKGGDLLGLIVIVMIVWLIWEFIFYGTHKRPLTENEIRRLGKKRRRKYIRRNYLFSAKNVAVNKDFKSSLNANGRLYRLDEELSDAPSLIAVLLKGKKHEWLIHAIEKDAKITHIWANKGNNNRSVGDGLGLIGLIKICKDVGGYSILSFHNHPNPNPDRYNCLVPSKTDKKSAAYYSEQLSGEGINYFDFVCERGRFLMYHKNVSPLFCPDTARVENIAKENEITKKQNYKLHRELGLLFRT